MTIKLTKYNLKCTFTQPVLGSQATKDVTSEFIATRAGVEPSPDEQATLPEALEKGTTVFHKHEGAPVLFDYQVKGFIKEAGRVLNGRATGNVKALRSKVDANIFVSPRMIPLNCAGPIDFLERPLRADTPQGPRVALARSEQLPSGTSFACVITLLEGEVKEAVLRDMLDYGALKGIGQWRNGGYGSFEYELEAQ